MIFFDAGNAEGCDHDQATDKVNRFLMSYVNELPYMELAKPTSSRFQRCTMFRRNTEPP
ncbi:MAG: hypothetical protein WC124_11060 [Desulfoplanes sp.]